MPGRVELLDARRVHGKRTGWHRHHDPRSKRFDAAPLVDLSKPISGNRWLTLPGPLNQGDLGSCTGNAAVEMASTTALRKAGVSYDEALAVQVYELGTQLDEVPGAYPPDDTGSTTVGVLKALQQLGLVGAYHWAFSFDVALRLLDQRGPLISGFVWHDSFDHPSPSGLLHETKPDRGGHAVCFVAIKPDRRYAGGGWVEGLQSWGLLGPPWIDGWRFRLSWATWKRLLIDEQGEAGIAFA